MFNNFFFKYHAI